jgi:hypothetical protein
VRLLLLDHRVAALRAQARGNPLCRPPLAR